MVSYHANFIASNTWLFLFLKEYVATNSQLEAEQAEGTVEEAELNQL